MLETLLSIIGAFIAIGLAVNAYFIKGLLDTITDVKIIVAVDKEGRQQLQVRVKVLEDAQSDVFKRVWKLEQKDKHL